MKAAASMMTVPLLPNQEAVALTAEIVTEVRSQRMQDQLQLRREIPLPLLLEFLAIAAPAELGTVVAIPNLHTRNPKVLAKTTLSLTYSLMTTKVRIQVLHRRLLEALDLYFPQPYQLRIHKDQNDQNQTKE